LATSGEHVNDEAIVSIGNSLDKLKNLRELTIGFYEYFSQYFFENLVIQSQIEEWRISQML